MDIPISVDLDPVVTVVQQPAPAADAADGAAGNGLSRGAVSAGAESRCHCDAENSASAAEYPRMHSPYRNNFKPL